MSAQHTPGPWTQFAPRIDGEIDETYRSIEAGDGYFRDDGFGFGLFGYVSEANARLIAAAPDLLAACEAAEHWLDHDDGSAEPAEMLRVLRAAIAKATGGA